MPKVDLIATKDFKYLTRRLVAGDAFEARNAIEAKILTRVRKVAKHPIIGGNDVYIPDSRLPSVDEKEPEQVKAAAPKPAAKKAPAKRKAAAKK